MGNCWLDDFCSGIRAGVSPSVADKVLKGFECQDESRKAELADWLAGVLDRFGKLVQPDARKRTMKKMGYDCAIQHEAHKKEKLKLDKFGSLDAYIDAEEKAYHSCGYGVRRDGGKIVLTYLPKAMKCRCYCSVWNGLPADRKASLTYCHCSAGHVEYIWRHITQRAIDVDVTCSCISGSDHCEFVFDLDGAGPLGQARG